MKEVIKLNETEEIQELDNYYEQDNDEELELSEDCERKIIWQAKDFSIREFNSMVEDGDLILRPKYQRKFVMNRKLSSRLIESILMDVPIPVIYLAEEKNGTYSVIDGQQRLTSFNSFIKGSFPDDNDDFSLTGLTILNNLNKKSFSNLDKSLQSKIKTTTLHTIIIKKESEEDIKFEIFERLNTGSIKLNEDEIRNTIFRGEYIKLLSELEEDESFHKLVRKDNYKRRMTYRGMILRFFALSEKSYLNYKPSMKQFCNRELKEYRQMSLEKQKEYQERFRKSVDLVYSVFGNKAFRRYVPGTDDDKNGKWNMARINMSLFDIQMCGFVNYEKSQIMPKANEIREAMIELMSYNEQFVDSIEIGTSQKKQLQKRFKTWFDALEKIVEDKVENRTYSFDFKKQLFDIDPACKICGQQIQQIDDAEVDHKVPYSKGGETNVENAQLTHRFCNRSKNNK